ncbi:hypothetical protein HDV03_003891 [Kappamyces sp. JEL0829]|nr:hypothetical protein HDV03_003891 [Kappamyces sp. JEL0829]
MHVQQILVFVLSTMSLALYAEEAGRYTYLASENGILSQVETKSGAIGWRQDLQSSVLKTVVSGSTVYALTAKLQEGLGKYTLYAFALDSGSNLWTRELGSSPGFVKIVAKEHSVLILNQDSIIRLDPQDGSILFTKLLGLGVNVLLHDESIYVFTAESFKLRVDVLDLKGSLLSHFSTQATLLANVVHILFTGHEYFALYPSSSGPQAFKLAPSKTKAISIVHAIGYDCDLVPIAAREPHFGAEFMIKSKQGYQVIRLADDGIPSILHTFQKSGKVFPYYNYISESASAISVVFKEELLVSQEIAFFQGADVVPMTLSAPFQFNRTGDIQWVSVDFYNKRGLGYLPRVILETADESIHCLRDMERLWTMEESLTVSAASVFIDYPSVLEDRPFDKASLSWLLEDKDGSRSKESLLSRLIRRFLQHGADAKNFVLSFGVDRFLQPAADSSHFGFRKLAIFASRKGKVVAVASDTGSIVWQRFFPGLDPKKLATHVVELNALTGQNSGLNAPWSIPELSVQIVPTNIVDDLSGVQALAIASHNGHLSLFPPSSQVLQAFDNAKLPFYFYTEPSHTSHFIQGFVAGASVGPNKFDILPTWRFSPATGEKIEKIVKPVFSPVASVGRVLGDRRVLFKYLNPNLIGIATVQQGKDESVLRFHLLDSVSGILHSTLVHHGVGPSGHSIQAIMCENLVVYSFWNRAPPLTEAQATAKDGALYSNSMHHELVVLELFESTQPNVRFNGTTISSFSNHRLELLQKSYIITQPVTSLGITSTLAGVTSKEILLGYQSGMVQGVSRRLLDPRRTTLPVTADDKEEGLLPYHPYLAIHAKDVASHGYSVFGIRTIQSLPSSLESTSIVMASGLDLFSTRRMPSRSFDTLSKDFSFLQLIASILALSLAVFYTGRQLEAKTIREAWE